MTAPPGSPVLHLCRGREWRGGERQVRLLLGALQSGGHGGHELLTGRGSALAAASRNELTVSEVSWSLAVDPRALAGLLRRCGRAPRPALLHAHDSHALTLALAARARYRIPVVATRRSISPAGPQWRLPQRVIAVSGAVAQVLREGGVAAGRIIAIESGVDLTDMAGHRADPVWPPVLVSAGALTREKGQATLLAAFAELIRSGRDLTLVLVGDGPLRRRLLRQAAALGIAERLSVVCGAEAIPWIATATVAVQPSLREALGTAVLEAMALGVPVVASDTGGLSDLLAGGAGALVPPGDPAALAVTLGRILDDPVERGRIRAAADLRVRAYDVHRMADRVAQVYRSVHCAP